MINTISPDIYERFKEKVYNSSLWVQEYQGIVQKRPLTDREIGLSLGLDEKTVREICCVAELDFTPLEWWLAADSVKQKRWRGKKSQEDKAVEHPGY